MTKVTYGEQILADNILGKLHDLVIAIKRAQEKGLFVDVKIGLNESYMAVYRCRTIAAVDHDRDKLIRSETIL